MESIYGKQCDEMALISSRKPKVVISILVGEAIIFNKNLLSLCYGQSRSTEYDTVIAQKELAFNNRDTRSTFITISHGKVRQMLLRDTN